MTLHALVDTGACRSMIKASKWRDICKQTRRQTLLRPGPCLCSLSGHEIPTKGQTCLAIYEKNIDFFVTEELHHDGLFGTDLLEKLGARICYRERVVHLDNIPLEYVSVGQEDQHLAAVHSDVDWCVQAYPDVFALDGGPNGCADVVQMAIDTGDHPPIRQRPLDI